MLTAIVSLTVLFGVGSASAFILAGLQVPSVLIMLTLIPLNVLLLIVSLRLIEKLEGVKDE